MGDETKTEHVVLRVTSEKKDDIARKAERFGLSLTDLVIQAVDAYNLPFSAHCSTTIRRSMIP